MDDFERDVLAILSRAEGASTANDLLERLLAGEQRAHVMYSEGVVEHTLFDLRREGLVSEAHGDMAEFHGREEQAPVGKRYWIVTKAGREALRSGP